MIGFVVGMVAAPIAAWCWGAHAVTGYWAGYSTVAVIVTAVTLACLVALWCRPRLMWPLVVLQGWCVLSAFALPITVQRMMCGAHATYGGSWARWFVYAGASEIAKSGSLPTSFAVFAAENNWLDPWKPRPCGCDNLRDVTVGRLSLRDFADQRITLDELREEARNHPPGEIERLGRISIWRNAEAWSKGLIVVWRTADDPQWDWVNAAGSLTGVIQLDFMSTEDVEFEIARAGKMGVVYPKEFIDLMNSRRNR